MRPRWWIPSCMLAIACSSPPEEVAPTIVIPSPAHEVVAAPASVELPPTPSFALPTYESNIYDPRELHARGSRLIDRTIEARGYIVAIYDCIATYKLRKPTATAAEITADLAERPWLCERPRFYLGSTKDADPDHSLAVVEVPRKPTKAEIADYGEDAPEWPAVPKLVVGAYVGVRGRYAVQSPHGESDSTGMLIYGAMISATPPSASPRLPEPVPSLPALVASNPSPVTPADQVASIRAANDCQRARDHEPDLDVSDDTDLTIDRGKRRPTPVPMPVRPWIPGDDLKPEPGEGLVEGRVDPSCGRAVRLWPDNHNAWYVLGRAYLNTKDWVAAAQAYERAARIAPDDAMYQLMWGVAQFEVLVRAARTVESVRGPVLRGGAAVVSPPPVQIDIGPASEQALATLLRAGKLDPKLWRAHAYAARALIAQDRPAAAAGELVQAIRSNPKEPGPYIALTELYRQWSYVDEAIAVATAGTQQVTDSAGLADLWLELGMSCDARRNDRAIEAFGKVLDERPSDVRARLGRAAAHLRVENVALGRADLTAALASTDPALAPYRVYAQTLLRQLASR